MEGEWDALVLVGRVARPHGLAGAVLVNPDTDFVEARFGPGQRFRTRIDGVERELVIGSARLQGARPVVRFEGIDGIGAAEALAGAELRIAESTLQPLADGMYYHHQLTGCEVVTAEGAALGAVVRVEGGAAGSLLVVAGARGEILIPLVADICDAIDIAGRRIRVRPPEGLVELNDTHRSRRAARGQGEAVPAASAEP